MSTGSSQQHANANSSTSCGMPGATETPNGYDALADCSLAALWDPSDATANTLPFLPRPKSLPNLKH